jgi:hypothetical protein
MGRSATRRVVASDHGRMLAIKSPVSKRLKSLTPGRTSLAGKSREGPALRPVARGLRLRLGIGPGRLGWSSHLQISALLRCGVDLQDTR